METEKETFVDEAAAEVLIRTPRLVIRRFGQGEWPQLLTYLQDDGVADYFPEGAYTEQRLRDMTADPYLYALVLHDDEEVIGHAFSRPGLQPLTGMIGLGIRSDYRRCGLGSETARALFRHAFTEQGLHRVTVSCTPENLALRAMLEKLGLRMEAFFRKSVPTVDGEWRDECVYSLLEDEWLIGESLLALRENGERFRLEDLLAPALEQPGAQPQNERKEIDAYTGSAGDPPATDEDEDPDSPSWPEAAALVDEELHHPTAEEETFPVADPFEEPDFPQVTAAIGRTDGSIAAPFVPIMPASVVASVIEPDTSAPTVEGTVVGVEWTAEPDPMDGLIEQRIDGVPFVLRRLHDFNWLAPFGRVFRVWDRQDSGNLSFGLEIEDQHVFIKYAGASTADYAGHPADAVNRLREAADRYETLRHPALTQVLDHFETPGGYAVLFEWAEGQLLRPGADEDGDTVVSRFRRLPIAERMEAMETVLEFHAHVEALGYVAIDFYDGSLMYDFSTGRLTICDIDLYRPAPYVNEMGRMWGSSRFMSPEEYELGAVIDSRTNVYTMGAMAFCLLGGERDRSPELWDAGESRYRLALRAVSPDREDRFSSVREMVEAWRTAGPLR
ncbi:GNAT family N-acetyltransferase [Saccharibacillus qingshengii]|uniref:GNAT family N-acetyltransferase n=1 Tax=Saccharibacillus qingshengii TaxID=1763540 RepID=UPI0015565BC9|nr:GNAT family N-acetyltransferase [Saccharibacillus qingshengii]